MAFVARLHVARRCARRWLRGMAALLLAALSALVLAAAPAAAQESDEGLLARLLQDFLSDAGREVRIRGFEGALSSRATIDTLSIADDAGVWLILRDLVLDWNRAALFSRRVEVNELSAREIHLLRLPGRAEADLLPSPTARPEFRLPELPVAVLIGELRADRVVIEAAVTGQRALVTLSGAMQLEGGQGQAAFEALRIDGAGGAFRFEGGFDNATRHLDFDLSLSEGRDGIAATLLGIPDRPAIALDVAGAGPIAAFEADIRLATDGADRVTGTLRLDDDNPEGDILDGLGFAIDIAGDLRPLLIADLHSFFGAESRLRAQGRRYESGEISLAELTVNTRTLRLVGRADLGADGLPRVVDLIADIAGEGGAPVVLPGTGGTVSLNEAALNIEYDAALSRDWRILAGIDRLRAPDLSLARVDLEAQGRLLPGPEAAAAGAPLFEGTAEFAVLEIEAADPAVQAALGRDVIGFLSFLWPSTEAPLEIGGLAIEGDTFSLTGQGRLTGTRFDGFLEAEAPDLSAFSGLAGRTLGGHLLLTSRGAINPFTGALDLDLGLVTTDLSIDQREFDSLVAGEARIGAQVVRTVEGTVLREFNLRAGNLRIAAAGQHMPGDIQLFTRVAIADLAALGPGYGGAVEAEARLASDGRHQTLRLEAGMRDLRVGDLPGAEQVRRLLRGQTRLTAEARHEHGQIELQDLRLEGGQLRLAAAGRLSDDATDLQVELGRLDLGGLIAGASGTLGGSARLTGEAGNLRAEIDVAGRGPLRSGLSELDRLLGASASLSGVLTRAADGALGVEGARLAGQGLAVTLSGRQDGAGAANFALGVEIPDLGLAQPGLAGPARLDARLVRPAGGGDYAASFSVGGPSGLTAEGSGRISEAFDLAMRFSGQVEASLVNPLIEPHSAQGLIRFEGRLDGPPRAESLRATARVSGGRFVSPNEGVAVQDIEARAELMGLWARIRVEGEGLRGGRASLVGSMSLDRRRDADLTVSVDRFRIARPRLFEASITGAARLAGSLATGARLSGSVGIDEAEIRIPNSPLGRYGHVPDGLRHVGETAASRRTREFAGIAAGETNGRERVPILLDLELTAPGRVFVRGRGLDAELGGTLRLRGTSRDVIPSGSFGLIRGRLDLLGNRFVLTDGSASMVGSFMPFIRLVASTDSGGVMTSVIVEGEADAPEIRFASVPELPEDEVLARLIFRRSLSSLSPFQAAQLALSVATLTGHAESSILTRTRQALGLDDLDFTTDNDGNTALRAGRYLSERVYTDISLDSTGRGEVSINLELSPSVSLRGRTDTEGRSGIGLFFERDY